MAPREPQSVGPFYWLTTISLRAAGNLDIDYVVGPAACSRVTRFATPQEAALGLAAVRDGALCWNPRRFTTGDIDLWWQAVAT